MGAPSTHTHTPLQTTRVTHDTPAGRPGGENAKFPPQKRGCNLLFQARNPSAPGPASSGARREKKRRLRRKKREKAAVRSRAGRNEPPREATSGLPQTKQTEACLPPWGAREGPDSPGPADGRRSRRVQPSPPPPTGKMAAAPPQLSLQQRPRAHARGTPGTLHACAYPVGGGERERLGWVGYQPVRKRGKDF